MEIAIAAIIPIIAVLPIAATVGSAVDCDCSGVVNSGPIIIVGVSVGFSEVGKIGIGLVFLFKVVISVVVLGFVVVVAFVVNLLYCTV